MRGLKPEDIFKMQLWEYNHYINGCELREKKAIANCILTGYYTAYYMNSRKPKSPNELINKLFKKEQLYNQAVGIDIRAAQEIEKKIKEGEINV